MLLLGYLGRTHGDGNGPMRSVALTNYDGNASLNAIQPVGLPFTLTLRCDHHATTSGDVEGDDDDDDDDDADADDDDDDDDDGGGDGDDDDGDDDDDDDDRR